jgi:hypothetical protein
LLVPRHERRVVRLLDEEVGCPAEQVGAVQVLDRVDDPGVVDDLVEPGKKQVRLVAQVALERAAGALLERLELAADRHRLVGRHDADRENAAVAPEGLDLRQSEDLGHGMSPVESRLRNRQALLPMTRMTSAG